MSKPRLTHETIDQFIHLALPAFNDHRAGGDEGNKQARALLRQWPELANASLAAACVAGNLTGIKQFLSHDKTSAKANTGPRSWQPLSYLCFSRLLRFEKSKAGRSQFFQCALLLLKAGASPNASFINEGDGVHEPALYGTAALAEDPAITRLLLNAGADVNDEESLYHAAESTRHACLKLLLQARPEKSRLSYCMCHQMDHEDPAGLKLFLDHGANPNFLIDRGAAVGLRPIHFAILRGRSVKVLKVLLAAGADPNMGTPLGVSAYLMARALGRPELAALLAKHGANTALTPREAFFAACGEGDSRTARLLLQNDPSLATSLSTHEQSLLPKAAGKGQFKAVKVMVDVGFPLEAQGEWGGSPLHEAAWAGHVNIVKWLLERGASLTTRNKFGGDALATAVHGAAHAGHRNGLKIVALLAAWQMKGNASSLSQYVKTALDLGQDKIVSLLQSFAGATSNDPAILALPVHRRTHKIAGWKPIMDAAFEGDAARIAKLLAEGADPNIVSTTPARYRPLHRAMEFKHTTTRGPRHEEAVRTLLKGGATPALRGGWDMLTALGMAAVSEPRFIDLLRAKFEPLDIFHAAALGDAMRLKMLLKKDKSLATAKDANGWTALHYAGHSALGDPSRGHDKRKELLACAQQLLNAGADANARYLFNEQWPISVLYGCCGRHDFPGMAELLIQAGADPCDGESVYHAADEGHTGALAIIERLTGQKALAAECSLCLPIMLHWGHTRGLPWLLQHGGDPDALSKQWGNSALHEAVLRKNSSKVIALLLKHGADPRKKNREGKSALDLGLRL